MPDYRQLTNPSLSPSKGNPVITKHYKKDNRRVKTKKRSEGGGNTSPPLLRDLLIMREGIASIKGYDQLAGEPETLESVTEDQTTKLSPTDITIQPGAVGGRKDPIPKAGDPVGQPRDKDEGPAYLKRGRRRGEQFNPQELELLRRAMLLIQQQGN